MPDREMVSWGRRTVLAAAVTVAALGIWVPAAFSKAGDLIVADPGAGPGGNGAIFRVDPVSGARTVIAQGSPFVEPTGVALTREGQILVIDADAGPGATGALFRVDPASGARTTIAEGPPFLHPVAVTVGHNGLAYVADQDSGPGLAGAVFRIEASGARTTLRDGFPYATPAGIAFYAAGAYVADQDSGFMNTNGSVLAVPAYGPPTGFSPTTISGGPPFVDPRGITFNSRAEMFVTDISAGPGAAGALFFVDQTSPGPRTTIAQGPPFVDPSYVVQAPDSKFFVTDPGAGPSGSLFRVDPATGARTTIAQGSPFVAPNGIAIEPPTCGGKPANLVGTTGRDDFQATENGIVEGTADDDVIALLGGRDRVDARRGRDIVCGGKGRDFLKGGAGKDRLIGGKGKDFCSGGRGKDRGKSCERGRL